MPHVLRLAAVAVLGLLLAACGQQDTPPAEETAGPPAASEPASLVHGGLLYDKFWKVSAAREPAGDHPLWATRPDPAANTRVGSTTWRCKECHGWDYRGAEGAYARGSHRTGFPGILGTKADAEALRTSLAETHGYRDAGLSDRDLESIVLFLRQGLVDASAIIDGEGRFQGDVARGEGLYRKGLGLNRSCRTCHGPDGLKPPKGAPPDYAAFVGTIANENPWEWLHKVRFGHPGAKMPAAARTEASLQDLADLGAYAQTLPTSK